MALTLKGLIWSPNEPFVRLFIVVGNPEKPWEANPRCKPVTAPAASSPPAKRRHRAHRRDSLLIGAACKELAAASPIPAPFVRACGRNSLEIAAAMGWAVWLCRH